MEVRFGFKFKRLKLENFRYGGQGFGQREKEIAREKLEKRLVMTMEVLSQPWWLIYGFRERNCKRGAPAWVWKPKMRCRN